MKLYRYVLPLSVLLVVPTVAFANIGSAFGFFQYGLTIPNFIIGLIEGLILRFVFKASVRRSILIMILANFATMIIGIRVAWAISFVINDGLFEIPLYHIKQILIICGVVSFFVTIFVEWPFVAWSLKSWKKALRASALAQTVTYALLVFFFLGTSQMSALKNMELEPELVFAKDIGTIYYFDKSYKYLRSVRINGTDDKLVLDTGKTYGSIDVTSYNENMSHQIVISRRMPEVSTISYDLEGFSIEGQRHGASYMSFVDLRPQMDRTWNLQHRYASGFVAESNQTSEELSVCLQTPITNWSSLYFSILPGNQVVYEMGNQIVLADLNNRKMGVIALGHRPIVVLDERPDGFLLSTSVTN